ncbi:hypothetical protein [Pseudomonas frederiksbergensis]|uniref:Uncharacterized protein n=1 Tax=Pseudomonas frederiksbergensis TaxID=104087 RepID=A0A423JQG6_9PSED|nr:hypothetical protein [Pseudomonas frederiksbergensis]RON39909.1 hypothetical protein BK666_27150 [Pseudomonas frederiksbergensis]RON52041.1 hypothetical protein BK667_15390 [Pseudomonas frederiksbergensis]
MHIALRAAGFSIMATFVSCGVGVQAQEIDTQPAITEQPVGASLLAKAVYQTTSAVKVPTPSRASPLPQGLRSNH